jgi:hypothetical protein
MEHDDLIPLTPQRLRLWQLAFAPLLSTLTVPLGKFCLLQQAAKRADSLFRGVVMRRANGYFDQGVHVDLCESVAARECWNALHADLEGLAHQPAS